METEELLDRFVRALTALAPEAVWAHGSLAGGDYQEGRSDLDLIAVLPRPVTPGVVCLFVYKRQISRRTRRTMSGAVI